MHQYSNKKVFPLGGKGEKPVPFVVEKGEKYRIVTLGYVDLKNPSGDAVINPLDETKVTIQQLGELADGSLVFIASHSCECGVHIEVFKES